MALSYIYSQTAQSATLSSLWRHWPRGKVAARRTNFDLVKK